MTSVMVYITDNSTDYMYRETFYGRHSAQIARCKKIFKALKRNGLK
jgi:hypothetical protein